MRVGAEQPSVAAASRRPPRTQPSPYAAIDDQICQPVNLGLLVGLLGCLCFWCAVAFAIVAAI
jgi:hypothetical protein